MTQKLERPGFFRCVIPVSSERQGDCEMKDKEKRKTVLSCKSGISFRRQGRAGHCQSPDLTSSFFLPLLNCSFVQLFQCFPVPSYFRVPCSSVLASRVKIRIFTLIELLIVIAMIAILAGLLLPALNVAKEKARTASCQNQLKMLGYSLTMYVSDYGDYIPPNIYEPSHGVEANWSALLVKNDYISNKRILVCPLTFDWDHVHNVLNDSLNSAAAWDNPWQLNWITYGMNLGIGSNWVETTFAKSLPTLKTSHCTHPSTTLAIADSRNFSSSKLAGYHYLNLRSSNQRIDDRHPGLSANIVWLDGHVTNMKNAGVITGFDKDGGKERKNLIYMNPYYK